MSDIAKRTDPQHPIPYSERNHSHWESDHGDESFEARLFLKRLLKHKYQILCIIIAVMVPTAIFTYMTTPLYRSSAIIKINPDPVPVLPYKEISDIPTAATPYEIYMMTQQEMLTGPSLSARVEERLRSGPSSEAVQAEIPFLSRRFGVRRIERSQLFEINYSAADPEAAADIVNIYAEEYMKEVFHSRQETREKAKEMLENELKGLKSQVEASEKELFQYARDHNITGIGSEQTDLVEQKLTILATQQTDIETELSTAKSRVESIESASVGNFPEKYLTNSLSSLSTQVLQLEQDLTALRMVYGENWPAVKQKQNELALIRDQLRREKTTVLAQALDQAEMDLRSVERRYELISTAINEQQKLVNRYRNASIQYNILRRDVETNQSLYEAILERLRQTSVTAGLEFGNIQLAEPGTVSDKPYSPKIIWNLGLAGLAGLALGLCFAVAMDFWDTSISTLEDAEKLVHLPVLGFVPHVKPVKEKMAIASGNNGDRSGPSVALKTRSRHAGLDPLGDNPNIGVAENIRSICASILLSRSDRPPRIIMVTSATPSEGKTTLVTHLGRAFAESGNNTLLVETDMRRPSLSERFGFDSNGGLSLFLSGVANHLPEIHNTLTPNLFAIASGPKAPNPVALFYSNKMDKFLKEIPSSYRFIILDAPPVLAVADAQVLCPKVDGIILVVKAGSTARNLVEKSRKLVESSGGNILGIVLNNMNVNKSGYGYYSQYYQ